ncbi:ribonuclease HII-domain-containing protein [Limtongia smithiae]|uniref:ribonuclease HII-domain-containing protein n=1 Tax=Limtongia smithiae TaxID=1125753 RepID=UPI0034D002FB
MDTTDDIADDVDETTAAVCSLPFVPPGVKQMQDEDESCTHLSAVPSAIGDAREPCILGVDEAGRGPVLGAMVYAACYCLKTYADSSLASHGFADSKVLTHDARMHLFSRICDDSSLGTDTNSTELFDNIGYATRIMSARDISRGMLRPYTSRVYNLNEQAHDATIQLICNVLAQGVNVTEIYVDTVGPPATYQAKLSRHFPLIQITVTKKADSLFPIVSAASVVAKTTRDAALWSRSENAQDEDLDSWGSGYPSDARAVNWLKTNLDPVFGWTDVVRFSWQTTKDLLDKYENVKLVEWHDPNGKLEFKPPPQQPALPWFGNPVTSEF